MENQGPKLIEVLEKYQDALEDLQEKSVHVQDWIYQARHGRVTSPKFRSWLENQIDYHGQKDRPYATYLQSLVNT